MEGKKRESGKKKSVSSSPSRAVVELSPKEKALAELDRAVDPLIRAWKKATTEHDAAGAEKAEAAYNKALDLATAKYTKWAKDHGEEP
ncbi:MAG: hypothetical protein L3J97_01430 [Thermoplasmata archaeon]|nr:hypothetical protein [Thermoplasmata archaeon]